MTAPTTTERETAAAPASTGSRATFWIGWLVLAGIVVVALLGLFSAPEDDKQGDTVRIIFVHVPVAFLTYAAFGLAGRCRRAALPGAVPARCGSGDLLAAGWVVNELEPQPRERLLERLLAARERGARLLVLEPLAGPSSPWWDGWLPRFEGAGVQARPLKRSLELPAWIARMDKAAGLDHRPLGARVLLG